MIFGGLQSWLDTFAQLAIGGGVIYSIIQGEIVKRRTAETRSEIARVAANVQVIEVATNSMKDALVASTAKASALEGEKRGREDEAARRDTR